MSMIQFFGLPGSGKTYIAKGLDGDIVKVGRFDKYFFAFCFFIFHPFVFIFFLRKIFNETSRDFALLDYKIRFLYFDNIARWQKCALNKKYGINDQGIFQLVLSLYDRKVSRDELDEYLKYLKVFDDDLVYIVRASRNVRKDRMHARGRLIRSEFCDEYVGKWSDCMESNSGVVEKFIIDNFEYREMNND